MRQGTASADTASFVLQLSFSGVCGQVRDIFYSGDPIHEKCTVITRIAPTFLRFGSFEIVKPTDSMTGRAGPSAGRKPILQALLNHTVDTYYPHIKQKYDGQQNEVKRYTEFFRGESLLACV